MTEEEKQKLLKEARTRLKWSMDEDDFNRKKALEDLEFITVEGAQWPPLIKAEREANGQPCLEINKLPTFIAQVVGDQRMNRPAIKVIPVDSKADIKIARILSGWVKHVEKISSSDEAVDHAFEHAVACGYGAIRVVTDFIPGSFDQEAYIQKIDNALAVYWGKHTKYDCSDAEYCFIIADISRDEYIDTYDKEPMPFNYTDSQYVEGWCTKDTVRVAEYFKKAYTNKKIYQLKSGKVVDKLEEGDIVVKEREEKVCKIMRYLLSGNDILEENEWAGKRYIPVIPVWGKELNVGGKRYIRGLIRNAKDSQRMYNYWQSSDTESVALQPRAPYLATAKQLESYENMWKEAHKKNYPYLLYNVDPQAAGTPQRQQPAIASSAMTERIAMADQEMRDTVGLQKASLGMQSNERSGAAIRERKKEGDVGTFAFIDNLARSIQHVGRVLVDTAVSILDTERIVRLGLEDDTYEFETINAADGTNIINDISTGIYDVTVTIGPSFTTQRTESQQSMREFIQYVPNAGPYIGDIYASTMDWPRADEVQDRLELMLPPEIQAKLNEKKAKKAAAGGDAGDIEAVSQPQPAQPNPLDILRIQQEELKLQEQQLKVQQEAEKLKGLQIDNELSVMASKENVRKIVKEFVGGNNNAGGVKSGQTV